ncbi:MAG: DUF3108 domain-containing protein [gamma proteobacterium symbiont of Taylorina sp.]|nr:DUF3108 domain-containing protein [gamma proteobacterium symbiont of Taylorina sp.]
MCLSNVLAASLLPVSPHQPFSSGETLSYKLSYRGILTSFIRADLADVKMTFYADIIMPDHAAAGDKSFHQFILDVSSENYLKAEIIHPVRYTYTTTMNASLTKTLLVEQIDQGRNNKHDVLWLDWKNKQTHLFKKREKKTDRFNKQKYPDFPEKFLSLNNHNNDLIYKGMGDEISHSMILDPLSFIYYLRTIKILNKSKICIAVSDDIRSYKIKSMGKEELEINGKKILSSQYKIETNDRQDKFFYTWLSDDKKKIPLRFIMDAPLGYISVDLTSPLSD